jgi:monooxygenase
MDDHGYRTCTPRPPAPDSKTSALIGLTSGYIQRAAQDIPKQGTRKPWRLPQNYPLNLLTFKYGRIADGDLVFDGSATPAELG